MNCIFLKLGIVCFALTNIFTHATLAADSSASVEGASMLDFVAPVVYNENNLPATPTGLIYYDLSKGAFKGINQLGAADTLSAPGNPVSSDAANERIERVAVASVCNSNPCTITSSTPAISSVTRTSNGVYSVNFASNKFSTAPTCVVTSLNTSTIFCSGGSPTTSSFSINCQRSSSEVSTDVAFNVICMGAR